MSKTRKFFIVLLSISIILTVYYIWSHSCQVKSESSSYTGGIYNNVCDVINRIFGEKIASFFTNTISARLFRKIGHFVEFMCLGVEFSLLYICLNRTRLLSVLEVLFYGLMIASIDEIIQIFSNRGAKIRDVLIDFCGYSTAILIVFGIFYLITKNKNSKLKTNENRDKKNI